MSKSIYRPEYEVFTALLKRARLSAGLTQAQCSAALSRPQSFISDVEKGTRRLDIVQLGDLCSLFGMTLSTFIASYEAHLTCELHPV